MVSRFFKLIIFNYGLFVIIGLFIYSLFNLAVWIQILLGMSIVSLLTKQYSQYLIIEKIKSESTNLKKVNEILEDDMNRQGW